MIGIGAAAVRHDIVLVGGGHTHVQVMTSFAMRPEAGVRLTLVTDRLVTPYSGMLPGHVAGLYDHDAMHIDLWRLSRATGVRIIHAAASGIDTARRQVLFRDRPPQVYDTLSLDVGITPDVSSIPGASEHAVSVKPISSFLSRLEAAMAGSPPRRVVVVGGGAAGVELACALRARLGAGAAITLLTSAPLVPTLNERVRDRVAKALGRLAIAVETPVRVTAVDASGVVMADGRRHDADLVLVSTAARAPAFLGASRLPVTEDGSLRIGPTLQVEGETAVFAVGDCATRVDDPREKAGVFAVRQGPVLALNLRRRVRGLSLRRHRAQRSFLTLLSTGDGRAIAGKGSWFAAEGAWVWWWKDRIDRRFMAMFQDFGRALAVPPTAEQIERGEAMRCGGCASKLGHTPLAGALRRLPPAPAPHDRVLIGMEAADDAAVVEIGGIAQVETVDQITAMISDPFVFGRIAALHAMSDVWAMGGLPTRALAIATVPHARATQAESDLMQLLAGARRELDAHGVALLGGHTGEAERMALGFAVTGGMAGSALRTKGKLENGLVLLLTKPLGTGIVLSADMRGAVAAAVAQAAVESMLAANDVAARILGPVARGLTDVTGFGLGGHLLEMLRGGTAAAAIDLAALPLLPGVLDLARAGHRSSLALQVEPLSAAIALQGEADAVLVRAVLFDPQTSGGLLAAVSEDDADPVVKSLRAEGQMVAVIGRVTDARADGAAILCRGTFRQPD